MGLDWDYGLDSIAELNRSTGVPVILWCYDTIAVDYPELMFRGTRDVFEDYLLRMGEVATTIVTISHTTKRDLENFYRRSGITRAPRIVALPLGCQVPRTTVNSSDPQLPANEQGYVVYVSTIEARKNHRTVVQVWSDLYRRYGTTIPTLVLVGMPGWGVRDLLEELEYMAVYRTGLIRILHHVSDSLLAALYRGCLFAVFPSIYEGWGLGAVEAMSYGKLCVISDAPALLEATQGLCPAIHPLDFIGWRDAIVRFWRNPTEREAAVKKIQSSFRMRTWQEFGRDFEELLAHV